jgi:hypothetical protein
VCASSQSTTVEASATSSGPAVSIWPPESQKPRVVYASTVYPACAKVLACARYSRSLSPQLLMKTIAGCRPAVVGSITFAFRTTPSTATTSTHLNPVVPAAVLARGAPAAIAGCAFAAVDTVVSRRDRLKRTVRTGRIGGLVSVQ